MSVIRLVRCSSPLCESDKRPVKRMAENDPVYEVWRVALKRPVPYFCDEAENGSLVPTFGLHKSIESEISESGSEATESNISADGEDSSLSEESRKNRGNLNESGYLGDDEGDGIIIEETSC